MKKNIESTDQIKRKIDKIVWGGMNKEKQVNVLTDFVKNFHNESIERIVECIRRNNGILHKANNNEEIAQKIAIYNAPKSEKLRELTFSEWYRDLKRASREFGCPISPDKESYREMYEDDLSPQDGIDAEIEASL